MRSASEGPPKREASASWLRRGSGRDGVVEGGTEGSSGEGTLVKDVEVAECSTLHFRREFSPCDISEVCVRLGGWIYYE